MISAWLFEVELIITELNNGADFLAKNFGISKKDIRKIFEPASGAFDKCCNELCELLKEKYLEMEEEENGDRED